MTAPDALWWAVVAAEACALFGAVSVDGTFAATNPVAAAPSVNRPLVALLAYALAADVAMAVLERHLAGAPRPFVGSARALYHLHTALVLGWPAALTAATWAAFDGPRTETIEERVARVRRQRAQRRRPPKPWQIVAVVWASWAASMAALHPLPRASTALCLRLEQAVGLVACVAAVVRFWRRRWTRAAIAVGVLVAVELALAFLGPWAHDVFRDWPRLARLPYALGFGAVAVLHVAWMRRR